MKKEKKNQLLVIIRSIVLIIVISLVIYAGYMMNQVHSYKKLITSYENRIQQLENISDDDTSNVYYQYDCSFTETYHLVNMLDGYISEVLEFSYIVVDQFQNHYATNIRIPTHLKEGLVVGNSYEVTYHLKGKSNKIMNDITYIKNNISLSENDDEFTITMDIKETDKTGLEQIGEDICSYSSIILQ